MRILWLKTELLHPVDRGGRIRTFQTLRALRAHHEITYLAFGQRDDPAVALAQEYAHRVRVVPHDWPSRRSAGFAVRALRNLLSPQPLALDRFRSATMKAAIAHEEAHGGHDVVVCDFLHADINLPPRGAVPRVLFQHNVEAVILERLAERAEGPLARWYYGLQARRMTRYEGEACGRHDRVITVSSEDAALHANRYGVAHPAVVPTGVDTVFFAPTGAAPEPGRVVFLGAMDWLPNEDGVRWFIDAILPGIRRMRGAVEFLVVGRNPGRWLRVMAESRGDVIVTGTVDDVRPYLATAKVFVVPLRIGGGTRLKIFEGMAMGLPVVSTTIGAEGLPLRDDEHLVLADTADAFAAAVGALLDAPDTAAALAARGRCYVQDTFDWSRIAEQFAAECALAARTGRDALHPQESTLHV